MTEQESTHHSGFKTLLLLILIFLVAAGWYFVLYEDYTPDFYFGRTASSSYSYISPEVPAEDFPHLTFDIDATLVDFDIYFTDLPDNVPFEAHYDYEYRTRSDDHFDSSIADVNINPTLSDDLTEFTVFIEILNFDNAIRLKEFNFYLEINDDYSSYSIISTMDVGVLDFQAQDVFIKNLNLFTTTGSQNIFLSNVAIENSISIETTTGYQTIEIYNLLLTENLDFTIGTTTGGGYIDWTQHDEFGADLDLQVDVTTGAYEFDLVLYTDMLGLDFICSNDIGDISFDSNPDFNEISTNHFQSTNYDEATEFFSALFNSDVGDIDIEIDIYPQE